jgi:hypothetical protein
MPEQYVVEHNGDLLPYIADSHKELLENIEDYKSNNGGDEPDENFTIYVLGSKYKMKRTVTLTEIKPPKKKAKKKAKAKHRKVTLKHDDETPDW